jgi:hypothetical protein
LLWVIVWVLLVLIPVNTLSFAVFDTPSGQWAAIAWILVVAANTGTLLYFGGITKSMSLPHLVAWGPLEIYLLIRLAGGEMETASTEFRYAVLLVAVNGISLVFDVYDSYRWLRGEREVAARGSS